MKDFQYITNAHPSYIENIYNDYVSNPESVDVEMKKFFEGYDFAVANGTSSNGKVSPVVKETSEAPVSNLTKEFEVYQLIQSYRKKGHLIAKTNHVTIRH